MKAILVILSLVAGSAFADQGSPGTAAFAAISPVGASFKSGNFRKGCQEYGKYLAFKSMVTNQNTDQWTVRNLSYENVGNNEAIISDFCSGPSSIVNKDQAAKAAESISSNAGLE